MPSRRMDEAENHSALSESFGNARPGADEGMEVTPQRDKAGRRKAYARED